MNIENNQVDIALDVNTNQVVDWNKKIPHSRLCAKQIPNILDIDKSVDKLIESGKSLCRFGDGEFFFVYGNGKPVFQSQDEELRKAMRRILVERNDNCLIALAMPHFYSVGCVYPHVNKFAEYWANIAYEHGYVDWINRSWEYLDSMITIPYHHYNLGYNYFTRYFNRIGKLFEKKDVLLVTGDPDSVANKNTIYHEYADTVKVIPVPPKNCFGKREEILKTIRNENLSNKYVVVLACGPSATVWAWELSKDMTAYDMGHLDREYSHFKNKIAPEESASSFFAY